MSPEIKVIYYNRSTWSGLWTQAFLNGLWARIRSTWWAGPAAEERLYCPLAFVASLIVLTGLGFLCWYVLAGWLAAEAALAILAAGAVMAGGP